MSYAMLRNSIGASTLPECAQLFHDTSYQGKKAWDICPSPTTQTGHDPPRPNLCGGAESYTVQNALKMLGLYPAAIDGQWNTATKAMLIGIAAKHNVPWNGDPFAMPNEVCQALVCELKRNTPYCSAYDVNGKFEPGPCWWSSDRTSGSACVIGFNVGVPTQSPAIAARATTAMRAPVQIQIEAGTSTKPAKKPTKESMMERARLAAKAGAGVSSGKKEGVENGEVANDEGMLVEQLSWWAKRTTGEKAAMIGGGVLVVLGVGYLALRSK